MALRLCLECGAPFGEEINPHYRMTRDLDGGPVHDRDNNIRTVPCKGA